MKLNQLVYSLCALLLAACSNLRQEVEPKGLVQEPEKLVVACFISPQDTVLTASITRSSPLLGTNNSANTDVTNATVTMSDGERRVILIRKNLSNGKTVYQTRATELPIVIGKTYTLTVGTPDGQLVSSSCTVPEPVAISQLILDSTSEIGQQNHTYYAQLRWQDPAGSRNFYRVDGNNESAYTYSLGQSSMSRDSTIRFLLNWIVSSKPYVTDQGHDGQLMQSVRIPLSTVYFWVNGQQQMVRPRGQVNAYLLSADENYYRYHEAVEQQDKVREDAFAEPVLIPTNIQGGLGCFGAYNRSTISLRIH